jgi:hypothetical protein
MRAAAQCDTRVTSPVGPLGDGEIKAQSGDQEQPAPVLSVRIGWYPADVVEAAAAIEHVQHAARAAVIGDNLHVDEVRCMPDDVSDESQKASSALAQSMAANPRRVCSDSMNWLRTSPAAWRSSALKCQRSM